ncbi:sigma-70 family RNA polymerase sigma factor [Streptococcus rifensis]
MEFKMIYQKVAPIVHRTRKDYYIQLWEQEDWDQEGMLVLSQLLESCPGIEDNDGELFRFFKTKFRNYVLDMLRKQESDKRKLNRQNYEEVSDVAHKLYVREMAMADQIILRDMLAQYRKHLTLEKQDQFDRLMGGETFRGKKEMLRDLKSYLKDFG